MKAGLMQILASIIVFVTIIFNNFSTQNGPIVLVGGGSIPKEAVEWLQERCLKGEHLVISCDIERSTNRWSSLLDNPTVISPEELTEERLENTALIVIEGGDQWDYLSQESKCRLNGEVIQKAHIMGIPILGTSAGAMILGNYFFTAEKGSINSEQAQKGERVYIGHDFVKIKSLEGRFIETHYTERERKGRLEAFLEKSGAKMGIGIDEATALCIDKDGSYHICGVGKVEFVNRD